MGNMGMAAMEMEEKMERMRQQDIENGHKPGCLISVSPAYGGGFCNCGKFKVHSVSEPINETHPLLHVCKKCLSFGKLAAIFLAADVASEFITFMPIHRFFEWMGWIT